MYSLKELYRIGKGPSSSHTMGPEHICKIFNARYEQADKFKVIIYGSLALTGQGHGTDKIIHSTLIKPCSLILDTTSEVPHPNTMDLFAYIEDEEIGFMRAFSVGGGQITIEGEESELPRPYSIKYFSDIKSYCEEKEIHLYEYVQECEPGIFDYLSIVWQKMKECIKTGILTNGILPGGLDISRKAGFLYKSNHINETEETRQNRLICAYAFAVGEQNASMGTVVTAPTCGAAGVLPAVLYHNQKEYKFSDEKIVKALATAGLIGNIIKTNASISGAECGCQAEIGSACSMAAAALGELFNMNLDQIEYAAEVAMEHHLGLTCDPVLGLVQIPCIERNAVAAMRAINATNLANFLSQSRKISFDMIVETMYHTGKDISVFYRETSEGGLAKLYKNRSIIP